MVSRDFIRQVEGYGLTTANIFYRLPDFPAILQEYVWQKYDLAPHFPELNSFLAFWKTSIEGPLHSIRVAHKRLISPSEVRTVQTEYLLH